MPDVPAQGGDGHQDGGACQQGSKTAILTSINRLLSRGRIVVHTFYSYLIFFFYIFCRIHFDLTSPADCRVGPGDENGTDGAGGVAEEKVYYSEIGKKAWLFAKLQLGRGRKRINAT